ncbi:MAG TPA: cupin domain-containing protein [Thermomicrobiales bacterium]|nr:cupin domain-containing protein [Thermomicrobiales bacterium]
MSDSSSTPEAIVLDCPHSEIECSGPGVHVRWVAGEVTKEARQWTALIQTELEPRAAVQSGPDGSSTVYVVRVEEGTVGLTASAPITCFGDCVMSTPADRTTDSYGFSSVPVPPGTEVVLEAGDAAMFEDTDADATHIYRNAGDGMARLTTVVTSPASHKGRCGGRCFSAF